MLVRDRHILAVAPFERLSAAVAVDTEVVDLGPLTIVPGFIDAHAHVTAIAYLQDGVDCSPSAAGSIVAIQQALAAASARDDGWVTGSGYADHRLDERRHPTRDDLDAAVPTQPCVLYHASLHACVVNSVGLARLGLTDATPDPVGGRLGRSRDGRLNGLLFESPMAQLFARTMHDLLDRLNRPGRAALIAKATTALARLGITTSSEAAADATAVRLLRDARDAGELRIRVAAMPLEPEARAMGGAGIATRFGDDRLWLGPAKLFADGGMSSRTAAMDEPYLSSPGERGMRLESPEVLSATVGELCEMGFAVGIHAQGERAIRAALDAFAQPRAANGRRHRIEHGGAFRSDLRERARAAGIVVVSQPGFISQLGDGFLDALGVARATYLYPFRSLQEIGVTVAGSSDSPVIHASPLLAMRDAVCRRTETGRVLGETEAVSVGDAMRMHTADAAFAMEREHDIGTLREGATADFVALTADPLSVEPQAIPQIGIALTVVGGTVVHEADRVGRRSTIGSESATMPPSKEVP
jgi:predicted amidohydrolase YtcJ